MAHQMQSRQQIPAEVRQLAEVHSLGAPTASYSKQPFIFWLILIVSLFVFLPSIVLFILLLFSVAPLSAPQFVALIFLIVSAVFGGYVIYSYFWTRKQQIHMYIEGFVYLMWRKAEVLRWDQIETIWYVCANSESNDWNTLRIRKTDGTELKVGVVYVLRDSSEIYRTIERELVRNRLPGMIELYEARHPIAFGDLSVDKLGLTRKGETLPWSQVESIDVGDQRVWIKKEGQKKGNWFKDSVPNQSLLRELVTHIRNSQ